MQLRNNTNVFDFLNNYEFLGSLAIFGDNVDLVVVDSFNLLRTIDARNIQYCLQWLQLLSHGTYVRKNKKTQQRLNQTWHALN